MSSAKLNDEEEIFIACPTCGWFGVHEELIVFNHEYQCPECGEFENSFETFETNETKNLKNGLKVMKKYITYKDLIAMKPCYHPKEIGIPQNYKATIFDFIKKYRDKVKNKEDIFWVLCRNDYMTNKDMRLFAVWCAREALQLVDNPDKLSIEACNVAERHASGKATDKELAAAHAAAWTAAWAASAASAAWTAAFAAASTASAAFAAWTASAAAWAAYSAYATASAASAASDAARAARAASATASAAYDAARAAARDARDTRDAQIDKLLTYFTEEEE